MDIPERYGDYINWDQLPHLWCPGCGNGIALKGVALALAKLNIPPHKVLLATGIGCSGRAGNYVSFHSFDGTHGRTLAFCTGINVAQPDLHIIAFLGDGDCGAIGGNHLLHAARRNLNVTVLEINNFNYAMTGGQFSPTTPLCSVTSTSRKGKAEYTMDTAALVVNAGANYVACTTVYHTAQLNTFVKEAILTRGFSFVEIFSSCPTYYGRYNDMGDGPAMMRWFKEKALPRYKYEKLSHDEKQEYLVRGRLVQRNREDFLTAYKKCRKK
ncbi:MAG: 2-oxoacid:ferredoxin oxidoreductase subunit beta [Candidatus Syntrophonatronum acetioxidans]|uniref:2-oxoacid:ferredoxin oxidoreductase subunit beta n=1 Tax=Candidatus Syntrophonatronum acetioxidans TaxID=1795816 RepID=A0A424YF62_9FIRM|nr:MAG: 2-oxoacid:ferredoxin oxidoreductase subunit beta [Candidatus Syntrophonatronum acetioxidans]